MSSDIWRHWSLLHDQCPGAEKWPTPSNKINNDIAARNHVRLQPLT